MSAVQASKKVVRQSISLPRPIATEVKRLAKSKRTSTNKVLLSLVERGIESLQTERERFFALADRLTKTKDPKEQHRLKDELARLTFGARKESGTRTSVPSSCAVRAPIRRRFS